MNYKGATSLRSFRFGNNILFNSVLDIPPTGITGTGGSGFQGPQGFIGVTGAGFQGPQGLVGNIGYQGLVGVQGIKGSTGDIGPTGPRGLQGDFGGPQGLVGPQGLIGLVGPQGLAGSTGPKGQTGPRGATGSSGYQGYQGVTGSKGDDGVQGPQGLKGDFGSSPGGSDTNIQYNNSSSFDGSNNFTYNYTNNVVSINGGLKINSSYSSRKWYSFKNSFMSLSSPLQLNITFDNTYFSCIITCMLTNSINVNDLAICKTECVGGTYDGSSPLNNILISSYNTSILSGSLSWIYPSTTNTQVVLSSNTNGDGNVWYAIGIEVINGSVLSINDNDGGIINFNY